MGTALPFMLTKHVSRNITCAGLFCFKMDAQICQHRSLQAIQRYSVWTHETADITAPFIPHTCEVLQRRALHPKAQHLLHREINRIIPVRGHVSAAASARDRTPLYRIAVLGFRRRHGGDRGGMRREAALPGAARLYRCLCFGLTSVSAPWKEGPLAGRFILAGVGGGCVEAMIGMATGAQAGRRTVG